MRDVTTKLECLRRAVATGRLHIGRPLPPEAMEGYGKGDIQTVARLVGLQWGKHVPLMLPDAHPVRLTTARVEVQPDADGLTVTAECSAIDRTGVEMEALGMCLGALMALWDTLKPALKDSGGQYPAAAIQDVRVVLKEKAGSVHHPGHGVQAAVVVATDSRREAGDLSGPTISKVLEDGGCHVVGVRRVPDDVDAIEQAIDVSLADGCRLVIVSGGTGSGRRDVTPAAIDRFNGLALPGYGEGVRAWSLPRVGPNAVLSRAQCVLIERHGVRAVVASLPGHPQASAALAPLLGSLQHAVELWGDGLA